MGLFQEISAGARARKLDFLVIGGLAVIFHGYARDTADLDLLVRRRERGGWLDWLSSLGYAGQNDQDNFVQLAPPMDGAWPVDLMLVADETFEPMLRAASEV